MNYQSIQTLDKLIYYITQANLKAKFEDATRKFEQNWPKQWEAIQKTEKARKIGSKNPSKVNLDKPASSKSESSKAMAELNALIEEVKSFKIEAESKELVNTSQDNHISLNELELKSKKLAEVISKTLQESFKAAIGIREKINFKEIDKLLLENWPLIVKKFIIPEDNLQIISQYLEKNFVPVSTPKKISLDQRSSLDNEFLYHKTLYEANKNQDHLTFDLFNEDIKEFIERNFTFIDTNNSGSLKFLIELLNKLDFIETFYPGSAFDKIKFATVLAIQFNNIQDVEKFLNTIPFTNAETIQNAILANGNNFWDYGKLEAQELIAWQKINGEFLKEGLKIFKHAVKLKEMGVNIIDLCHKYKGMELLQELERVKESNIKFANYNENPEMAQLFMEYNLTEQDFNKALSLWPKNKSTLPDIDCKINKENKDEANSKKIFHFYKLRAGDIKGLVLGKMTNSCQSIGGHSEKCVIDGYQREDTDFYVIAEQTTDGKEEIIGQSYAWIGSRNGKKVLVLDSYEALRQGKSLFVPMVKHLLQIIKDHPELEFDGLYVGTGGQTPTINSDTFNDVDHPSGLFRYPDSENLYHITDNVEMLANSGGNVDERIANTFEQLMDEASSFKSPQYFTPKLKNIINILGFVPELLKSSEEFEYKKDLLLYIEKQNDIHSLFLVATALNEIKDMEDYISKFPDDKSDVIGRFNNLVGKYDNELIDILTNITTDTNTKFHPIHYSQLFKFALYRKNDTTLDILVKKARSLNEQESCEDSLLFNAAVNNRMDLIKKLVENGADINFCDKYNSILGSLLLKNTKNTIDPKIIVYLIKNGADINKSAYLYTPSKYLSSNQQIAHELLVQNVKLDFSPADVKKLLHDAISYYNFDFVKLLLNNNALNKENVTAENIIAILQNEGPFDLFKTLVEKYMNINDLNKTFGYSGKTMLYIAVENNNIDAVKLLLEKYMDNINDLNKIFGSSGKTILHIAVEKNNIDVVKLLLEKNVNTKIRSDSGNALDLAKSSKMTEIADLIEKHQRHQEVQKAKARELQRAAEEKLIAEQELLDEESEMQFVADNADHVKSLGDSADNHDS